MDKLNPKKFIEEKGRELSALVGNGLGAGPRKSSKLDQYIFCHSRLDRESRKRLDPRLHGDDEKEDGDDLLLTRNHLF